MTNFIIQNNDAIKVVKCSDFFEATMLRDACRETLQIALKGDLCEVFNKDKNAFIIKSREVYVELVIR